MANTRFSLHPACKLFPKLGDVELRELADDIKANGLQNAIILLDGKILDGRNRHAACKLAGVEPRFEKWKGKGSPVEWVISQNLMRRHLTASQRAVVALDLLPLLEKEAKQRQRLSRGRGKKGAKPCATISTNGKSSETVARITGSNARYVEMVKAINKAAPDVVEHIRCGDISVNEGNWIAELPARDRTSLLTQINGDGLNEEVVRKWKSKRSKKKPRRHENFSDRLGATSLIHGDCRKELKGIPTHSIDAIITDPIYPEVKREYGRISEADWHDLMRTVVSESKRILKPTGSAVFILQPNYDKVGKMRLWLWEL